VTVEGIKAGRPGLTVSPPLVVYDGVGSYSTEVQALLRGPPMLETCPTFNPSRLSCEPGSGSDSAEGRAPPGAAD
jgi:hypothetical protein